METAWKVFWISWILLLSSLCISAGGNKTAAVGTSTTRTDGVETTTLLTSDGDNDSNSKENPEGTERSQGDLDLETQDQVAILKQINRVNEDGSYTFGYEAADGSFKIETRDVNGNVKGMFGFINEDGELKRVSYSASNGTGFQSTGTLNIPPLPGTTLSSDEETDQRFGSGAYNHIYRVSPKRTEDSSTKISLLDATTPVYEDSPDIPSPRLPIYIFGSSTPANDVTTAARPVVIQHIPKVRPTPASSSTIPTESEEILLKPLLSDLAPKRTSNTNYISFGNNDVTSAAPETATEEESNDNQSVIQVIRPRTGPYKKVIVTKRPVTTTPKIVTTTEFKSKDYLEKLKNKGSTSDTGVRRQLGLSDNFVTTTSANLVTSGTEDSPDVYGGRHVSRPYPSTAYRALFSQVPQHQRILQNSYLQNRHQYLAAALGNPGIPTSPPPQVITTTTPNSNQVRTYSATPPPPPPDASAPPVQPAYIPTPVPQPLPDVQGQKQFSLQPNYVRPYPATTPPSTQAQPGPPYPQEQLPNSIYIPPALIEQLIRMLILAQQRYAEQRQQPISPFQQAVIATLGPGNVPPELLGNRYDPRYYQTQVPYPNYSQTPNPYTDPMSSRPPPYNPQYSLPYYQPYVPVDPRYAYQPQVFSPIPYARYQPRAAIPYEIDPVRQQQQQQNDEFMLRMLLDYQRYQPQGPLPSVQPTSNVVERSPAYPSSRDSTTASSTTTSPRVGPVRNVEILGQINEDSQSQSSYESSTKPEE